MKEASIGLEDKIMTFIKNIRIDKKSRITFIVVIALVIISIFSYLFIASDEGYYKNTIAKITSINETKDLQQMKESSEPIYRQQINAVIMNGKYKGNRIHLRNETSYSQAYDLHYKVNDEVFVGIKAGKGNKISSSQILDFKRDKYIAYAAIIFVLLILIVGGLKGFRSLVSVIVNVIISAIIIKLYLQGANLMAIAALSSLFFIVFSITIVNGLSKKSVSAIVGTIAGTVLSMGITIIVMIFTNSNGVHYEEMEFLTRPPEQVFMMELLIGTLGGIMDIAISISSAIKEMYDKNPDIERKVLIKSSMEIGKDIMGTMANTLVFAYMSGSIPIILLWLKNGYMIFNIISVNISLEIIRALTGSIGIVISIPITLYISVILLKNKRIGEV